MGASLPSAPAETEGKRNAPAFQLDPGLETRGKPTAIACLNASIESFIVPRNWSRAQLAEDICGMSEANFSKVVNGNQGDFWGLVYKLPADIRADFYARLHESEKIDPLELAAEQLIAAAQRFLRLMGNGAPALPAQAAKMAKAAILAEQQRKRA